MNAPLIAAQSRDGALTTGGVKRRPSFSMNWAATFWGRVAALHHNPGPVGKDDFPMATVRNFPPERQPAGGTIHWLNACIERAKAGVFSEVGVLTPGLAAELLRRNGGNRIVRSTKSEQYAADIRAGRWAFNGETLIIADTGEMNDGQHRCGAVVETNLSIPALFVFGLPRDSRFTIDQGAARGAADYATMDGVQNAGISAAVARMLISYEQQGGKAFTGSNYVTNGDVLARIRSDNDIAVSATFAASNCKYTRQFAAPAVLGFCHYVFSDIEQRDANDYLTQVCRGEGLKARDPAYTVRDRLMNLPSKGREKRVHIIFRGWNAYRQGRSLSIVKVMGEDNLPALV